MFQIFSIGVLLGAATSLSRLKVLILVPVILALVLAALVNRDLDPITIAIGVQVGYFLGLFGFLTRS